MIDSDVSVADPRQFHHRAAPPSTAARLAVRAGLILGCAIVGGIVGVAAVVLHVVIGRRELGGGRVDPADPGVGREGLLTESILVVTALVAAMIPPAVVVVRDLALRRRWSRQAKAGVFVSLAIGLFVPWIGYATAEIIYLTAWFADFFVVAKAPDGWPHPQQWSYPDLRTFNQAVGVVCMSGSWVLWSLIPSLARITQAGADRDASRRSARPAGPRAQ